MLQTTAKTTRALVVDKVQTCFESGDVVGDEVGCRVSEGGVLGVSGLVGVIVGVDVGVGFDVSDGECVAV